MGGFDNVCRKLGGMPTSPKQQIAQNHLQAYAQDMRAWKQMAGSYTLSNPTNIAGQVIYCDAPLGEFRAVNPQTWSLAPALKSGDFRRTVKEGEMRYSAKPLLWLDERIDEIRVVL